MFDGKQVADLREVFEPFFERSVRHSPPGMLTTELLFEMVVQEAAVCFATARGDKLEMVLVVRMTDYATYRAARIIACAGRGLKEAVQFIDALEAWALTQGAVEIEAWCRPAMVRLARRLGWAPKTMIVSRNLRRKLQ